jgi:dipeptidyl aminopeptidase/acylaminoacyl peptidase
MMLLLFALSALGSTTWQQPPQEVLDVLHAPELRSSWVSPTRDHVLMLSRVRYPALADRAAAMLPLAGVRVDGRTGGHHGHEGYADLSILSVADGTEVDVALPEGVRASDANWSGDGKRLAVSLIFDDHIGLWVGTADGQGEVVEGLSLVPMLGGAFRWSPDHDQLLVRAVPVGRGPIPQAPAFPAGPIVRVGDGDTATSTYESRNTLGNAHDERLFEHFGTSQLVKLNAKNLKVKALGKPGMYTTSSWAPGGLFVLVERLVGPWSHRHGYWRFGSKVEIWTKGGKLVATVSELPLADAVPIHGVPEGPRSASWVSSQAATLVWLEALDGGDWSREVEHRDKMMAIEAPFQEEPREIFRAEHRVERTWWGEDGLGLVQQYERARRWKHVWTLDLDDGKSKPLFDLSTRDRYADPGRPLTRVSKWGRSVLQQEGDHLFFSGQGGSDAGDRPFLDRRSLVDGSTERLWRSDPERHEYVVTRIDEDTLLTRSESPTDPPNLFVTELGDALGDVEPGEATLAHTDRAVTKLEDPTPVLRDIERRIVTYEREDGVPLSFILYTPPGYEEGTPLPTIVYAYPREFSDPKTAGQVAGSQHTFERWGGPSHLFFLLQGYAVLHRTRMPVIGDPDTAYDTFVEQLVSGAQAAVDEAVRLGVTDPERVGVMGHSHGGLMTVTLLAHSDIFQAGIARSGAYNHTIRPFGFQSERRTLWAARDTYLHLSPVMHAPKINEPLLLIHGELDENPGTVSLQSERLFEAVRGVGGTVRLLMLPHEGHGYRALESVEHTLWEQFAWFDRYVKGEQ